MLIRVPNRWLSSRLHRVAEGNHSEILNKRYVLMKRLGKGPYSVCWLAKDCELNMYYAIKVYKSAPYYRRSAEQEARILGHLNQAMKDHSLFDGVRDSVPSAEFSNLASVARLVDCFLHFGSSGTHCCLVTEVLGPSLESVLKEYKDLVLK